MLFHWNYARRKIFLWEIPHEVAAMEEGAEEQKCVRNPMEMCSNFSLFLCTKKPLKHSPLAAQWLWWQCLGI